MNSAKMTATRVGQRLLRLRRENGCSQVDFARRLNVSVGAYQGYERGEREAPSSLLTSIYKEFGTDPLWVLGETGDAVVEGAAAAAAGGRLEIAPDQFRSPAGRLRAALEWVNEAHGSRPLTPSQIAEGIGELSAAQVEEIFAGTANPAFSLLDGIAAYLGLDPLWVKHNQGSPFLVQHRGSFSLNDANEIIIENFDRIIVVRNIRDGNLAIVMDRNDLFFRIISTSLLLDEKVGAAGVAHLAAFSNACRQLLRTTRPLTTGALVPSAIFEGLVGGSLYAGSYFGLATRGAFTSNWIEDWWDPKMFNRSSQPYWPGFKALCATVYDAVEANENLRRERDEILAHQK